MNRSRQTGTRGTGDLDAGRFGPKAREPWEMTREEYAATTKPSLKVTKPAEGLDTGHQRRRRVAAIENRRLLRREWRGQGLSDARIRERFRRNKALDLHRGHIERALSEGRPILAEVLEDYPDLAPRTGRRRPRPARRGS